MNILLPIWSKFYADLRNLNLGEKILVYLILVCFLCVSDSLHNKQLLCCLEPGQYRWGAPSPKKSLPGHKAYTLTQPTNTPTKFQSTFNQIIISLPTERIMFNYIVTLIIREKTQTNRTFKFIIGLLEETRVSALPKSLWEFFGRKIFETEKWDENKVIGTKNRT